MASKNIRRQVGVSGFATVVYFCCGSAILPMVSTLYLVGFASIPIFVFAFAASMDGGITHDGRILLEAKWTTNIQ